MSLIKKYIDLFKCPNSWEDLYIKWKFLISNNWLYKYPILDSNFIEFLPEKPYKVSIESSWISDFNFYHSQIKKHIDLSNISNYARWVTKNMSLWQSKFINYELNYIKKKISLLKNKKICIDISWWCGTHTFELASNFDLVIHFDLWDQSLNYAYHQAKQLWINNILFIRWDFFNLPFKECIADIIISIDTFIYYSIDDDIKVLKSCQNIINKTGVVMTDFHNKKPLNNNKKIHEYDKKEIKYLKKHFKRSKLNKFCNIPAKLLKYKILLKIERIFIFSPFFVRWFLFIYK